MPARRRWRSAWLSGWEEEADALSDVRQRGSVACADVHLRCQRTVAERRDSGKTQVLVVNSLMIPLRSTAPCTPAAASSPAALAGPHVRSRPLLLCAACSDIRSSFTAKGASRVATENHVPTVKALCALLSANLGMFQTWGTFSSLQLCRTWTPIFS